MSKDKMYKVTIDIDTEWVKNFGLIFKASSEAEAESNALVEVKQNLTDYITAYAEEVK